MLKKIMTWATAVVAMLGLAATTAYTTLDNSVDLKAVLGMEPDPIVMETTVTTVPREYAVTMLMGIYADGRLVDAESREDLAEEGLLYVITVDYDIASDESWSQIYLLLEMPDGTMGQLRINIPGLDYMVDVDNVEAPFESQEDEF